MPESRSIRNRLWRRCFLVNFSKFLRTIFRTEHLRATASVLCQVKPVYLFDKQY